MWLSVKLRAISTYCTSFQRPQSAVYLPKGAQAFPQNSVPLTNYMFEYFAFLFSLVDYNDIYTLSR